MVEIQIAQTLNSQWNLLAHMRMCVGVQYNSRRILNKFMWINTKSLDKYFELPVLKLLWANRLMLLSSFLYHPNAEPD